MVHVAARLGLSDRGLAKICARYNIPVPPRGWWARKQHGYRVRQTPLPPAREHDAGAIVVHPSEQQAPEQPAEAYLREKRPDWRIEVPPDLAISHPLVKRAATSMRRGSGNHAAPSWRDRYRGQLVTPGAGELDIAVSKPLVPRALRIMQALLAAFDRRSYVVSITSQDETIVKVLGEPFQVALRERLRQVAVQGPFGRRVELEPSGRLSLRVGPTYSSSEVVDNPPRLIEGELNRFVARLVKRALAAQRERLIGAERDRRWRGHDEERRRRQQERDSESLRRHALRKAAARVDRHQRMREFVQTVERRVQERQLDAGSRALAQRWLEWAKTHLDGHDPVDEFLKDPWPIAPLRAQRSQPWDWTG